MKYDYKLLYSPKGVNFHIDKSLHSIAFVEIIELSLIFCISFFCYWLNVKFLNNNFFFGFSVFLVNIFCFLLMVAFIKTPKVEKTFNTKEELINHISQIL